MDRVVTIGDRQLGLRATALTPRLYRFKMGRDIIRDMANLRKAFAKAVAAQQIPEDATDEERELAEQDAQLSVLDLTIFENIAYIMARQYDPTIPATPEEWLDSMDQMFTIYELLPDILALWDQNQVTTSVPKKK